jgi:outer membrane protein TolC
MKIIMNRKLLTFLILAFVLVPGVSAQMQPDSLDSYLKIAASGNPGVLRKYNEYQASVRRITRAGAIQDPDLSLGIYSSPMEIMSGKLVAEIRLMQMFPWFGTLKSAKDEMSQMAKADFEALRATRLQLFYDVRSTWYELIRTHEAIRIYGENLDLLRTIKNLSLVRYSSGGPSGNIPVSLPVSDQINSTSKNRSGMQGMSESQSVGTDNASMKTMENTQMPTGGSGITDIYRIELEINELENNILLLRDKEKTIGARFNSYLNRDPLSAISIPDSVRKEHVDIGLLQVNDSIFNSNPMLVMLKYEEKSAEAREKMVTLMGYPMTGLGVNYSIIGNSSMSTSSMNGRDMIMPMVSVTLPVYRKKYRAMREEAGFEKEAVMQNYQATANSLRSEFYEALELYQDAGRRMKLYEEQTSLVKKSFGIMIKSFGSGGNSLTDLLQVRRQLADYELKETEAITDYNTSVAWINKLLASQ